jgi:hypothetical protein
MEIELMTAALWQVQSTLPVVQLLHLDVRSDLPVSECACPTHVLVCPHCFVLTPLKHIVHAV